MTTETTSTKETALKVLAELLAKAEQLRTTIGDLSQVIKSDKPGAIIIWKRSHALVLETKTSINSAYKYASAHDRETGVDQHRAEKKAKAEERAARKGKDKADDKDEPITEANSDDPDNV